MSQKSERLRLLVLSSFAFVYFPLILVCGTFSLFPGQACV